MNIAASKFHADFARILELFCRKYGPAQGKISFAKFLELNSLDPRKKYHPFAQFHESFNWITP